MAEEQNKIIVFESKSIRRLWHEEEWWFAVTDVIAVLTESTRPSDYWYRMKKRELESTGIELSTNCRQLKMEAPDGKMRNTECANTQWLFRIIQSVPSKKAEPFKQWLAKIGHERIQEIENPELAAERARQYYRDRGYTDEWIEKRLQSIAVRGQLTDEWKARDIKEGIEYAILTAEISQATFGLKPSEHKEVKVLKKHDNLRDHMTNLELIFTMLGEEQTKQEAIRNDAQGLEENKIAAAKGGAAAGKALEAFEEQTKQKVVSDTNFKEQIKAAKKQKKLEQKKNQDEDTP